MQGAGKQAMHLAHVGDNEARGLHGEGHAKGEEKDCGDKRRST